MAAPAPGVMSLVVLVALCGPVTDLWAGGFASAELKLLPPELEADDHFGGAVAAHRHTVVVGARFDDDGGVDAGAAYVYRRVGAIWVFDGKLVADDAQPGDEFGVSVGVHDEYIVVGAHLEDTQGQNAGAAYVFTRETGAWTQDQKLIAPDGADSDFFGRSVAISGDPPNDVPTTDDFYSIVVGAPFDSINGLPTPDNSGSATLFELSADTTSWDFKAKLTADLEPLFDAQDGANFGAAVAISGDLVVVGAPEYADTGPASGAAYRFVRINIIAAWVAADKLTADDAATNDFFGQRVATTFDFVVNESTTVVGARRNDDFGGDTGSAYVFFQLGQEKLLPDPPVAGETFGRSVSINLNQLVVGADGADFSQGAAYLFARPQAFGAWSLVQRIQASDGDTNDLFGSAVAIDDSVLVVGAPDDEDAASGAGAAYIYDSLIFIDGFDSGSTSVWSGTVP